jgi:GNAT superfamily N-acetyltransferase
VPPLTSPARIRAILATDRPWAVYALGDLSPRLFGHCAWFAPAGPTPALVLLFRAFDPPTLLTFGPAEAVAPLLDEIGDAPALYLHVRPEVMSALERRYEVRRPQRMWRMLLAPGRYRPAPSSGVGRLGPADLPALERLFADGTAAGEVPHFFAPYMLEDGTFFGAREGGELSAVAGTHLVVPEEGVAAVGNVYTRRDWRGRGLGAAVTSAVVSELVGRGVPTIALNVGQDNAQAVRVYERLGFARYCEFVEGLAERRVGPPGA